MCENSASMRTIVGDQQNVTQGKLKVQGTIYHRSTYAEHGVQSIVSIQTVSRAMSEKTAAEQSVDSYFTHINKY